MTEAELRAAQQYADLRIDALDGRVDERFKAVEKHTALQFDMLCKDIEHMNGGSLMPRSEYNIAHEKLEEDIRRLNTFKDTQQGKASQTAVIVAWAIGLLGIAVGIAGIFVKG